MGKGRKQEIHQKEAECFLYLNIYVVTIMILIILKPYLYFNPPKSPVINVARRKGKEKKEPFLSQALYYQISHMSSLKPHRILVSSLSLYR